MNIDDKKMDELLRNVSVPSDLKAKLLEIPGEHISGEQVSGAQVSGEQVSGEPGTENDSLPNVTPVAKPWPNKHKLGLVLAIAASLLAMVAIPMWVKLDDGQRQANTDVPSVETENDTNKMSMTSTLEIEKQLNQLKERVREMEVAQLRSDLQSLEQLNSLNVDSRETDSIIQAIAGQTPMFLNGDKEAAVKNMVQVSNSFPDTIGSQVADTFLATF